MRLALRVQSQSRATVETLGGRQESADGVCQTGEHRQCAAAVNNGSFADTTRVGAGAREIESGPNELLEQSNGERMDTGAASGEVRSDTKLETVGSFNRTDNSRRKAEGRP